MKIKTKIICLITFIVFLQTSVCIAQYEVWRVYFPGYTYGKSSIDHKGFLHIAFIGNDPAHQNMFLTLNGQGAITYKKVVSNFPLYFLKDSTDCSYELSYDGASVSVDKYDPQQNLLWNHVYSFITPVDTNNFSVTEIQYSFQAIITPSGKLAMAGILQDSTYIHGLTLITADTSSGSQLSTYASYDGTTYIIEIQLQEDNNGSINMAAKDWANEYIWIYKISAGGSLQKLNGYPYGYAMRTTDNFIYIGCQDFSSPPNLIKLNQDLDTVYYINPPIDFDGGYPAIHATDSELYISNDFSPATIFETYDYAGNLVCTDSMTNSFSHLYKQGSKVYGICGDSIYSGNSCNFAGVTGHNFYTQSFFSSAPGVFYHFQNVLFTDQNAYVYSIDYSNQNTYGIAGIQKATANDFSGRLYFDANSDCIFNAGDVGLPNQLIKIDPAGYFLFTDDSGVFENFLDSGSYSLSAVPFNNTLTACPVNIPLTITDTTLLYANNDIAIQDVSGNLQDLSVTINQTHAAPGQNSYIWLNAYNSLPLPASGIVKLTIDTSIFTVTSFSVSPDSVSGNQYYWDLQPIGMTGQWNLDVNLYTDSAVIIGTNYITTAEISNISGEPNTTNNYDLIQANVISSYDPNEKSVNPVGVGSSGFINSADTLLNFKIQFQNTGNYLAYKIRIVDTLDVSFDVSTFRLLSTSHACSLLMPKPGILEFIFNDIMLPDSNSNELLSHGFINYSIELKNNLPYNTTIKNKAAIYFDYNEPVSTNQTINTIGAVGIQEQQPFSFRLFPNPVNDMIYLELNDLLNSCTARIFDLQGRLIYASSLLITTKNTSLSTRTLKKGFYILELTCKNGRAYKSFVKL